MGGVGGRFPRNLNWSSKWPRISLYGGKQGPHPTQLRLCLHYTRWFLIRAEYEQQRHRTGETSCSHTSNITPEQLVERVWCTKFSPHSWIFTSAPWISFLALTYSLPLLTLRHTVAQNLSDMWRSTLEIGALQLRSVKKIEPKSRF